MQRDILRALAASDSPYWSGGLPIHRLKIIFGLSGDRQIMTGSQRASLSRSLRRLEHAGFVTRPDPPPCYAVMLTATGWAAVADRDPVNDTTEAAAC